MFDLLSIMGNPFSYTGFYLEDVSGQTNTVSIKKSGTSAPTLTIETSSDGKAWSTLGQTDTTALNISVPANGRVYVRCSATTWTNSPFINSFTNATGNFKVGGNIMSLLYGSAYTGEETSFPSGSTYTFYALFLAMSHLVDASALVLPATTLIQGCYYNMFNNCTSLTTAPALPATTLQPDCYNRMFGGCTSLMTAPPVLPATTLTQRCYQYIFYGCTSLNSVTCLATDITESGCTDGWLTNVASTGTFTKAASMSSWTTGASGIPSGWTVVDAS